MSLRDTEVKHEYRSLLDNMARDFYVPLLSQAIFYKRAVGFFSSTVLNYISHGIGTLAKNNGKIQIVASPKLSEKDIEAIKNGYVMRDNIIRNALLRELKEPKNPFEERRLNLLANLIADGIMDIKIAFTEQNTKMGMYHEKMGLISDAYGNVVAFSGSMNESATAIALNYEAIDVFCSWKSAEQREKVESKQAAFTSIWDNTEPNITIIDFPELSQEIIDRYKRSTIEIDSYDEESEHELFQTNALKRCGAIIPEGFEFHDYQKDAIAEWERKGFRGIFDMATGTGKTYTGLGALARLCDAVNDCLGAIIVCPYQHLVEQWVEDIMLFNVKPIIGFSSPAYKDWPKRLDDAIRDQKLRVKNREFFCFVCTNATFATDRAQNLLNKIRGNVLIMVDEAHNFGSIRLSNLLSDRYKYRLALSATLERHNDEEGTEKLCSYFGPKCIEYDLERAIAENKLTPYKYYPIITVLNEAEMEQYEVLTYEIGKCMTKGKNGKMRLSEKGKYVAIARARLVAGAVDKISKLEKYITPYRDDKHVLVYCGATTLLQENRDTSDTDDADIRQIDEVTKMLGEKLGMRVHQFTSKEDIEERDRLKREFAEGSTMQALIAIKCLDEGVNIPMIKTAFILASTTNPKEYIQRRGRVLRRAEGKEYAEIYDFIALPRELDKISSLTDKQYRRELSLIKNELKRAEEFTRLALNMVEAEHILDQIKEAYSINEHLINYEEDFANE
jgi:superfamily II DNA or RNA helicase